MVSFSDISSKVEIDLFSGEVTNSLVRTAFGDAYETSILFQQAVDNWISLNPSKKIVIEYWAAQSKADEPPGTGRLHLNPADDIKYISQTGEGVQHSWRSILFHELGHALINDNWDEPTYADLKGGNLQIVNGWYGQLGIPEESGYFGRGAAITVGKQYSDGVIISNSMVDRTVTINDVNRKDIDFQSYSIPGSVVFLGSERENSVGGTDAIDYLYGEGGNDSIRGYEGDDHVFGGGEGDTLWGEVGDDWLYGGDGSDIIKGGEEFYLNPLASDKDRIFGEVGDDIIDGGSDADEIDGGEDNDRITGGRGDDIIEGGGGNDVLFGGYDTDTIRGGIGNDTIDAAQQDGPSGNPFDNTSPDQLWGGNGADTFFANHGDVINDIDAGDTVTFDGVRLNGGSRRQESGSSSGLSGTYTTAYNPITYTYDEDTKTLVVANGSNQITIKDFENGEAGIRLKTFGSRDELQVNDTEKPPSGSDPLVLDLDGDGVELISRESREVYFDINDDGLADRVGWVGADDGMLARDLNNDGRISRIGELFGTSLVDGFTVLAEYDSNNDGVINASDAVWSTLRIWRDADLDADTDTGELKTLAEWGITSISLDAEPVDQTSNDNRIVFNSTYQLGGGPERAMSAVFFSTQLGAPTDPGNADYVDAAYEIPELSIEGLTQTLRGAVSADSELLGMVQDLVADAHALNSVQFRDRFDAILMRWAGVDDIDPASRGAYADAQHVAFLERLSDSPSFLRGSDGSLLDGARSPSTGAAIEQFFDRTAAKELLRFGSQLATAEVLSGVDADGTTTGWFAGLFNGTNNFDLVTGRLLGDAKEIGYGIGKTALTLTDQLAYLEAVAPVVQGLHELPSGNSWGYSWSSIETDFGNGLLLAGISDAALLEFAGDRLHGSERPIQLGTEADDLLTVRAGLNNTFVGGDGNDVLTGGEMSDTYVYTSGDGNDLILETANDPTVAPSLRPVDRLLLIGIERASVEIAADPNNPDDVMLTFADGGTISLVGQLLGTGIEEIVFANGDRATASDLANLSLGASASEEPDFITGSRFDDILEGQGGDDQIEAGLGNDTLTGGTGDDVLVGNGGDDTYIYTAGDGHDTINGQRSDDDDPYLNAVTDFEVLVLHGIAPNDVTIRRDENGLNAVYEFGGASPGSITVLGFDGTQPIDEVRFDDGTTWGPSEIRSKTLFGSATNGDDYLVGFDVPWGQSEEFWGQDELAGGKGNDTLEGLTGRDTYRYLLGDGDDTIIDHNSYYGQNQLVFDDLLASDLDFTRAGTGGKDLLISVNRPEGGSVLLVDGFGWEATEQTDPSGRTVAAVTFADGSQLTIVQIASEIASSASTEGDDMIISLEGNDTIDALGGDDTIFDNGGLGVISGGAGNDRILARGASVDGGAGDDTIDAQNAVIGGEGDDQIISAGTLYYRAGDGHDTVLWVYETIKLVDIDQTDVTFAFGSDREDLTINIGGDEPGSITIKDIWPEGSTGASYGITFGDGSIISTDAIAASLIDAEGTTGNDQIVGVAYFSEVIEGRGGDDELFGSLGSDTYVYRPGDGNDVIHDADLTTTLRLHGISSADVQVANDGGDALFTLDIPEGGSIRVSDMFSVQSKVRVLFDDGTRWTTDQLIGRTATFGSTPAIVGTVGNDSLSGSSQAETFEGNAGDDTIHSGGGHDIVVFNPGDGHDTISGLSGLGMIKMGVTSDDVTVLRANSYTYDDNVIYSLRINSTGDTINLTDARPPLIEFSDGSRWDAVDLAARLTVEGTTGNDDVSGLYGDVDEIFDLRGGSNDVVYGGGGEDTFLYREGSGFLSVSTGKGFWDTETKTLELRGVDPGEVQLTLSRGFTDYGFMIIPSDDVDLVFRFEGASGGVKISGAFDESHPVNWSSLDQVRFDDGTVWTIEDFLSKAAPNGTSIADTIFAPSMGVHSIEAGEGNDTIYGGGLIRGGGGDDTIWTGAGAEIHWAKGDGNDQVSGGDGGMLFLDDVLPSDAAFSADGTNLRITVGDEVLTLWAQLQPSNYYFEELEDGTFEKKLNDTGLVGVRFSDGTIISKEQFFGLVPQVGTENSENLVGSVWGDVLSGGAGDDAMVAREGDDTLNGGDGADELFGGAGDDNLAGDAGDDRLVGGAGSDVYEWSVGDGSDRIDDKGGRFEGVDTLRLHGVEAGDLKVERIVSATTEYPYDALRITVISSGETITIDSQYLIDYLADEFLTTYEGGQEQWTDGPVGYGDGSGPPPPAFTLTDLARGIEKIVLDDETVIDPFDPSVPDWVFTADGSGEYLSGTAANDTFDVWGGSNTINGGEGVDTVVYYSWMSDYQIGKNPNGTISLIQSQWIGGLTDTLSNIERLSFVADGVVLETAELPALGTNEADSITGSIQSDILYGMGGNDTISSSSGNDYVDGGDGVDLVTYSEYSTDFRVSREVDGSISVAQSGSPYKSDTLLNIESIYFSADSTTFLVSELPSLGTVGNDIITGSERGENLYGQDGDDEIHGLAGDDFVTGNDGVDILDGGDGNDALSGGIGDDTLSGGSGSDYINGDEGNDLLIGGDGDDFLDGGQGTDTYSLVARTSGFGDTYITDLGDAGEDDVLLLPDANYKLSTDGTDLIITSDLNTKSIRVSYQFSGEYGIEGIDIDNGARVISIDRGTAGNDLLSGSSDDDIIFGSNGDDTITGGAGDDLIVGGAGADLMGGGGGADSYDVNDAGDFVAESVDEGNDTVYSSVSYTLGTNLEAFVLTGGYAIDGIGNALSNVLRGNDASNTLQGLYGDDYLEGEGGDDVLEGGDGNDQILAGAGNDTVAGGDGYDTAIFAGAQSTYTIQTTGGSIQIIDNDATADGDDGTDDLAGIEKATFKSGEYVTLAAPIVLDLNGDGTTLVDDGRSKAKFDWDSDGVRDRTGWVNKKDGLLVYDRDGNRTVSGANELSFIGDKAGAKSDLDGLRAFDTDGDGVFSSADEDFAHFMVWRDKDGDGRVDKKEMMSLAKAGVASINLGGSAVDRTWGWGEDITINTGSYTRTDGTTAGFSDVALNYASSSAGIAPFEQGQVVGTAQPAMVRNAASQLSEAISGFDPSGSLGDLAFQRDWRDLRGADIAASSLFR